MAQKEFCQVCRQKHDCRKVYRQLGSAEGPPVTAKVVLAFLLPLVVFIACLGGAERMLAGIINEGAVLTAVSVLLALLVTFACIVMIKKIRKSSGHSGSFIRSV